jgi:hypothetical protein
MALVQRLVLQIYINLKNWLGVVEVINSSSDWVLEVDNLVGMVGCNDLILLVDKPSVEYC